METYLTFSDETSHKFWYVRTDENKMSVTFGRVGTAGQTQEKYYPTAADAEKEVTKQAAAKLKKGYTETPLPEGIQIGGATTRQKAAAAKPDNGPADVADDGTTKSWHKPDYFTHHADFWLTEEMFDHLLEERDVPWGDDGYKPCSTVDAKVRENFRTTFGEKDLLLNTDRVLARAYKDGRIFVYFKIEGEQAYSETLDYLIHLLEKGYAELSHGYSIGVRFVVKPTYIKELPYRDDNSYRQFERTACHAFFARAVEYPALREKVKCYADTALRLGYFYYYLDIEQDCNVCICGGYAAIALAFADEQYVPLISLFAAKSDDEHQDVQLHLIGPLQKRYGPTPDVAVALYNLQGSNGQHNETDRFDKALLSNPACLAAVMEHVASDETSSYCGPGYVHSIWGNGEDDEEQEQAEAYLKKFKKLAKGAATVEDRKIFVAFHNFYKQMWEEENSNVLDVDDLKLDASGKLEEPKPQQKQKVIVPVYPTDPLLSREDAKKAGWEKPFECSDGKYVVFLYPACIDNPCLLYYMFDCHAFACKFWLTNCQFRNGGYPPEAFNNWVINTDYQPHAWGVLFTAGEKKPYILYGLFDIPALAKHFKRPFKTAEDAERARLEALLVESPEEPAPTMEERAKREKFGNWTTSVILTSNGRPLQNPIEEIKLEPKDGRYYDAALLLRAETAINLKHEFELALALYNEFLVRRPEFAENDDLVAARIANLKKKIAEKK